MLYPGSRDLEATIACGLPVYLHYSMYYTGTFTLQDNTKQICANPNLNPNANTNTNHITNTKDDHITNINTNTNTNYIVL